MVTIYKKATKDMELVTVNDTFFNKYTADLLDEKAADIIAKIDNSEMISKYMFKSRYNGAMLDIDRLSTGCKTVLNIVYNQDKIFDIRECGENAIDYIYELESGNIYCQYPLISFNVKSVGIYDNKTIKTISDYEELKEWWEHED